MQSKDWYKWKSQSGVRGCHNSIVAHIQSTQDATQQQGNRWKMTHFNTVSLSPPKKTEPDFLGEISDQIASGHLV